MNDLGFLPSDKAPPELWRAVACVDADREQHGDDPHLKPGCSKTHSGPSWTPPIHGSLDHSTKATTTADINHCTAKPIRMTHPARLIQTKHKPPEMSRQMPPEG